MPDLAHMSRLLYQHEWSSLSDWSAALADLASLSDDQIQELVVPCFRTHNREEIAPT